MTTRGVIFKDVTSGNVTLRRNTRINMHCGMSKLRKVTDICLIDEKPLMTIMTRNGMEWSNEMIRNVALFE